MICLGAWLLVAQTLIAAETRLIFSGGAGQRLGITILSEGYRASEREQFFQQATNLVETFFAEEPFREYKNYFNARAIFVESAESGSDHPGYPLLRNTYFNSTYDGSDRVITIPASGMSKVAALLSGTDTDLPVMLVNDLVYGGSGGSLLVVSRSASSPEILLHESGHTLAGLGDEYTDASSFVPTSEPPNTTRQTSRNLIKWRTWISTNTPVPTPPEYTSDIGLFEGAQNQTAGWYRPKFDCRMRSLNAPFCEVCREALVKAIYQKTRLITEYNPPALTQTLRSREPLSFSVQPFQPATHSIEAKWFFDGSPIADATNNNLILDPQLWTKGTHLIRVDLRDSTEWVRNDPTQLLKQSITWRMDKLFPESTLPTVTIASPSSGARLNQPVVTMAGTALDNVGIEQVFYSLNDGPFLPATGTTSWNFSAELQPGPNTVRVKSVDLSGNESLPKTRALNYVILSPLHLTLEGQGTVAGVSDGQLLEAGRVYRITARPAAGNLFQGWSGGIEADTAALSFAMQTNLELNARFVPNPYLIAQGEYVGFFQKSSAPGFAGSGLIQFRLRSSGSFSGKLSTLDADYPFAGKFNANKTGDTIVKRIGQPSWPLALTLNEQGNLSGVLGQGEETLSIEARRTTTNTNEIAKKFNIALPGQLDESSSIGDSVASASGSARSLRITGTLADGTAFTQSAPWVNDGWPLFWRTRGVSMALGWVSPGLDSPFAGEIDYIKRPSTSLYPAGLFHRAALVSSPFVPPDARTGSILNFTLGELLLQGGNLAEPVLIGMFPTGALVSSQTNGAILRFTSGTGRISGSFRHPATGKISSLSAILLQNQTNVAGVFLGTNETGRVSLSVLK